MAKVGKKIKNFSRPVTGRRDISLDDLSGQYVVLYFYPKDNTPGCTVERASPSGFPRSPGSYTFLWCFQPQVHAAARF